MLVQLVEQRIENPCVGGKGEVVSSGAVTQLSFVSPGSLGESNLEVA